MSAPLLVIVGPTGAGKSALAMGCAEALDGEIVSADSVQVYRGLDIGTAKPTAEEQVRVRHWCIDVADPSEAFDVTTWRTLADAAIEDITARGKTAIVCGGTGFYVRVLLYGLDEMPAISPETRAQVREEVARLGAQAVHARLAQIDPESAARIAPNDRQRLSRALEVHAQTGVPLSTYHQAAAIRPARYPARIFGVWPPRPVLYAQIETRAKQMWRAGVADEVRRALDQGVVSESGPLASACYRPMVAHVRGEDVGEAPVDALARAHRRYAKRQLTWFRGIGRRDAPIHHVDPTQTDALDFILTTWSRSGGDPRPR